MENLPSQKILNIAVVYHYPCCDGSYAALVTYLYYKNFSSKANNLSFFLAESERRISEFDICHFDKILIMDKGLHSEDYEWIISRFSSKKVLVFDHHLSSINLFEAKYRKTFNLISEVEFIFNSKGEKSACGLALEYFLKKAFKHHSKEKVLDIYTESFIEVI